MRNWSYDIAVNILETVLAEWGFENAEHELVRMGSNAIFSLKDLPYVVRVSKPNVDIESLQKRYDFVERLVERGFPATAPSRDHRPKNEKGYYVTCWQKVTDTRQPVDWGQFASLLKEFHRVASQIPVTLPLHDPFMKIDNKLRDIEQSAELSESDIAFLKQRTEKLRKEYQDYQGSADNMTVIHGDAHTGNVITTPKGLVLCDFDDVAFGYQEWDLIQGAVAVARFNIDMAKFQKFSETYGCNILEDPNADLLIQVRELSMVTWLCQNKGQNKATDREIAHRIETMHNEQRYAQWTPL